GTSRLPDLPGQGINACRIRNELDGHALRQWLLDGFTPFRTAIPVKTPRAFSSFIPARRTALYRSAARTRAVSRARASPWPARATWSGTPKVGPAVSPALATRAAEATRAAGTARASGTWAAPVGIAAAVLKICIAVGRLGLSGPGGEQLEIQVQFDF